MQQSLLCQCVLQTSTHLTSIMTSQDGDGKDGGIWRLYQEEGCTLQARPPQSFRPSHLSP